MTNKEYGGICLLLGFLAAIVTALFYGMWSLAEPVPDHSTLLLFCTKEVKWTIQISRWWDVLFAFALINVYGWIGRGLLLWCKKSGLGKYDISDGFVISLTISLANSFLVGLVSDFVGSLFFGLILGLATDSAAGFAFGLVSALAAGLGIGLFFGLFFVPVAGLAVGLVFGLVVGLKYIFSR